MKPFRSHDAAEQQGQLNELYERAAIAVEKYIKAVRVTQGNAFVYPFEPKETLPTTTERLAQALAMQQPPNERSTREIERLKLALVKELCEKLGSGCAVLEWLAELVSPSDLVATLDRILEPTADLPLGWAIVKHYYPVEFNKLSATRGPLSNPERSE